VGEQQTRWWTSQGKYVYIRKVTVRNYVNECGETFLPLSLPVNNEFEYTMPVRGTELHAIYAWFGLDSWQIYPDMGVEHRKFKLHIFDPRVQ
jgi:hypothetical protein